MTLGRGRERQPSTAAGDVDVEAAARFHEFGELDMARFQVGFPPQHLLLALVADYWPGRSEPLPSAALVDLLAEYRRQPIGRSCRAQPVVHPWLARRHEGWSQHLLSSRRRLPTPAAVRTHSHPRFAKPKPDWDGMWTVVVFTVPEDQRRVDRCCAPGSNHWASRRCTTGCGFTRRRSRARHRV